MNYLLKHITDDGIFGTLIAWVYVIEFQKRGLPHSHILVVLANDYKLKDPESVNAEFSQNQETQELVKTVMVHGPCGTDNPKAPCMSKGFLSIFQRNFAMKQY
ncbi:hypothetical protein EIN_124660 [Entamoeba invadens IP1]|uniref:Helitron helicase-like domain-containing protein n=1 Tax=Entamoeba invadens IP1 TaxID=370355 RepID=L7FK39_ENTIV|nr:hypothetical protein EIN_124660 [Entamoeba invadens IP1]ELP83985.1 hypothetical protein EIN_124660 [Entamoeba invadens IP1]|eukprot:XP_004183331.1 hypothetical protein EIN_124660 [Entamoeba invadens IP1]